MRQATDNSQATGSRHRATGPAATRVAFTLAELMVGLAITAVVGLAAATLSSGISSANGQTNALSQTVQSGRIGLMKIDGALRKAQLVTAAGSDNLTLWNGDANGDKQMNLDELVQIYYDQTDPNNHTVCSRQVSGMSQALNVTFTLASANVSSNVTTTMNQAVYQPYRKITVLADHVSSFQVITDSAAPYTRLVEVKIGLGSGGQQLTLSDSAVLRADMTSQVTCPGGVLTLTIK